MSDNPEALTRMLNACRKAAEWLEGWASAEPYLSILEQAIAEGERALAAQSGDAPPPLPPAIMYGRCAGLFTADQMRERDAMWQGRLCAALAQQAATPTDPSKPMFATSVARRKWERLQADGHRMQRLYFERADGSRGTIDAWGVVMWGDAAAQQAATPAPAEPERDTAGRLVEAWGAARAPFPSWALDDAAPPATPVAPKEEA